jgi:hypothetical protein
MFCTSSIVTRNIIDHTQKGLGFQTEILGAGFFLGVTEPKRIPSGSRSDRLRECLTRTLDMAP